MGRPSFFIFSSDGDALFLAWRLQKDGYAVQFYCHNPEGRKLGLGLVPVVGQPDPPPGAVVLFDGVGLSDVAARFRRRGHPVLGGNRLETWETDRAAGLQALEDHGLTPAPWKAFANLARLDRYLATEADPALTYYFKPDGKDIPKAFTRSGDPAFLRRFIAWAGAQIKDQHCVLQEEADEGEEIDVNLWLNATGEVAAEITVESKKFLAADHGPATGCQSNVVWDVPLWSAIVDKTIRPLTQTLLESGYVGQAALNSIITDDETVQPLELTLRLGFDSSQAQSLLWDEDLGDQLAGFADGSLTRFVRNDDDYAMTLRISAPPQPTEDSDDYRKFVGMPLDGHLLEHPQFMPDDVMRDRQGKPISATGSGMVGVVGTVGGSLASMRKELIGIADGFEGIIDAMYRLDPVPHAEAVIEFLQAHELERQRVLPKDTPTLDEARTQAEHMSRLDLRVRRQAGAGVSTDRDTRGDNATNGGSGGGSGSNTDNASDNPVVST